MLETVDQKCTSERVLGQSENIDSQGRVGKRHNKFLKDSNFYHIFAFIPSVRPLQELL
jgi:hypothetical protein